MAEALQEHTPGVTWAIFEDVFARLQDFGIIRAYAIILLVHDVHSFKVLPEVTVSGKDLVHSATEFVWYFLVFFVGFGIGSQNFCRISKSR